MQFSSIRIRPELRAAQVERARRMTPALTLYFDEKYDLGETDIPASFRKVTLLECMRILASTDARVLEIPEPLWLRFAPKSLLLWAIWKFSGFVRRRPRTSVAYAIENNDLRFLISPNGVSHPLLERATRKVAGIFVRLMVDRIVFGSSQSRRLYHSLNGVGSIPYKLIEELPVKRSALELTESTVEARSRAIFIGELDDRKGILDVMRAWPAAERALQQPLLTIVGGGKYADAVARWCEEKPESRSYAGFVQHDETARLLGSSHVLIAPSRRSGRWREQIGLPIVEGLSAGLTIVTTDETGLATWLRDKGHVVITEGLVSQELPDAITKALSKPLPRTDVWATLPETAGRVASDMWLHLRALPTSSEDNKS